MQGTTHGGYALFPRGVIQAASVIPPAHAPHAQVTLAVLPLILSLADCFTQNPTHFEA
jgi:hypothetical protein